MHSNANIDAHRFEGLLTSLAVKNIVSQVEFVFDAVDCGLRQEFGEPPVGFLRSRGTMDMSRRGLVLVLCEARKLLECASTRIETLVSERVWFIDVVCICWLDIGHLD